MQRPSEEEIATGLARLLHELSDEDLFRDRRARREAVRQAVIAEQRRAQPREAEKPPGPARAEAAGCVGGDRDPDPGARAVIDPGAERWRRLTVKEGWRRFVDDEPTGARTPATGRLPAAGRAVPLGLRPRAAASCARVRADPLALRRRSSHARAARDLQRGSRTRSASRRGAGRQPREREDDDRQSFRSPYERRCRQRHPDELTRDGHEYLPVVYVNVDALPTIKGLNHALLTFYGMGPPRHANARQLTQLVLECARSCRTSLIVIDDIHLLELRREADRDANNHLKRLANDLQATFVYAGVGLSHGGFMHEGRYGADAALAQISQRFKRLAIEPLRRSTPAERATWLGVLQVFERELVLLQSKPGDLTGQADYLWRRTQGVIGSLTQLLTEAAAEAIDTGAERITSKLLDAIDIGYAAEVGAGRQQPHRQAA